MDFKYFWELFGEILNAGIFLFIGVGLVVARPASVIFLSTCGLPFQKKISSGIFYRLVWEVLRGMMSISLVLATERSAAGDDLVGVVLFIDF